MAFAFKSGPRFLAGLQFQTGPWELRTVAAKNKSHDLIEFQLSLGVFYLCNNLPPLAACAPTFLALGVMYMKPGEGGWDYPITLPGKQPKPEPSITLLLKSSCDSWDGFPQDTALRSGSVLCYGFWLQTPHSSSSELLGELLTVQAPGSGAEDTVPSPGTFQSCSRDTDMIPNPTLSQKRKIMGRGFGIGVPNVPSLFPALYVEREERHSHVTSGNCTILPSAPPR